MSRWRDLGMQHLVHGILQEAPCHHPCGDFGKPFISAYQLACQFRILHPDTFHTLDMPLGGEGAGGRTFTGYLAQELARSIRNGVAPELEGRWYYSGHVQVYDCSGEGVRATSTMVSVFRLRECPHHRDA